MGGGDEERSTKDVKESWDGGTARGRDWPRSRSREVGVERWGQGGRKAEVGGGALEMG